MATKLDKLVPTSLVLPLYKILDHIKKTPHIITVKRPKALSRLILPMAIYYLPDHYNLHNNDQLKGGIPAEAKALEDELGTLAQCRWLPRCLTFRSVDLRQVPGK